MKYFGIIDEASFKGYSNTVKSLLEDVKDKEIIDIGEVGSKTAIEKIINHQKSVNNLVEIVSAADMGLNFLEEFSKVVGKNPRHYEYSIATDKFFETNIDDVAAVNLFAPDEVCDQYIDFYGEKRKAKFPKNWGEKVTAFVKNTADLVASPKKADMEERAKDFKNLNPIAEIVSNVLSGDAKVFFMGGRVSLPDGSFKENTEEIFAKAGVDFAKDGKNGVVVFHGLRSFTKGDKSNDFAPVEAFYTSVKNVMHENQTIVMLTKEEAEEGKRKSIFRIFQKENGTVYINDYNITDSKYGAADYYFLLNEAVKKGLDLTATVEQMNFIPEALELGADRTKLNPYKWELSVPSNHAVYQKLFDGKDVKTQKQAFDMFVDYSDWKVKNFKNYDARMKAYAELEKKYFSGR